jgi:hypothetical protein
MNRRDAIKAAVARRQYVKANMSRAYINGTVCGVKDFIPPSVRDGELSLIIERGPRTDTAIHNALLGREAIPLTVGRLSFSAICMAYQPNGVSLKTVWRVTSRIVEAAA